MNAIEVCLIQEPPVFFDLEATTALVCQRIAEFGAQGVDLLVFPETWLCGYPAWIDLAPGAGLWDAPGMRQLYRIQLEAGVTLEGPELAAMRAAAQKANLTVVLGAQERRGKSLYNTLFTLGADGVLNLHRKLTPTYTERLLWAQGDGSTLTATQTKFGILGGLICWEHWLPLARAAMQAQQELVHVAVWPEVSDLHRLASRHYAFEGGCYVLASGCHFTKGDILRAFDRRGDAPAEARALLDSMPISDETPLRRGLSAVYAPDGNVVAEAEAGPHPLRARLDLSRVAESRMYLDTTGHYARPDVFHLEVNTQAHPYASFEPGK